MKLTTKSRYGLRAMIDLASREGDDPVSLGSVAQSQGISEAYLEQLFAKLKKAGLVTSSRGAQGGYRLACDARDVSVGDILRALEGNLEAAACPGLSETGCKASDSCVTIYVWKKINESITRTVDSIHLDELVRESRRGDPAKSDECGS